VPTVSVCASYHRQAAATPRIIGANVKRLHHLSFAATPCIIGGHILRADGKQLRLVSLACGHAWYHRHGYASYHRRPQPPRQQNAAAPRIIGMRPRLVSSAPTLTGCNYNHQRPRLSSSAATLSPESAPIHSQSHLYLAASLNFANIYQPLVHTMPLSTIPCPMAGFI
jgi:hypothetical protein